MCQLKNEEIHKIREENYERTKNMTDKELLEYTKEKASKVIERLNNIMEEKVG